MKSIKSAVTILTAVLVGAVLGAFLSRPPHVKAMGNALYVHLQKVHEGDNMKGAFYGSTFLGFACTQQDCYVATTE